MKRYIRSSTVNASKKFKRISRYGEFDNGYILFDYKEMDDDTAEDMARQASLDDPNDVYYVKYDDIMNPCSDWRWYQGKKYDRSDIDYKNGRYQPVTSAEDPEFEKYEDEIKEIDQEFTSENTSINSTKLPAVFKMVSFKPGTVNIDYGGGRFDNVADYLAQYDVINLVYDPYNRTQEHNKEVIKLVKEHGGADTATCSNVLNVIKEPEVRKNVLQNIKKLVKPSGEVYITVYEGTGKGDEGATKSGYQLNRKTADYLDEIQEVFPDAKRKGKLIIAHPNGSVTSIKSSSSFDSWYDSLSPSDQDKVDNIADENGIDFYDEASDEDLAFLKDQFEVHGCDSIKAARDYGGAFDIDPYEYFTKDEILEFADECVEELNMQIDDSYGEFYVEDTYIVDYSRLVVDVTNYEYEISAQVDLDMRRIRKPSDIYKYKESIVSQLAADLDDQYVSSAEKMVIEPKMHSIIDAED